MEREEFEAKVAELRHLAEEKPEHYKARVAALVALGFACVMGLLGLAVAVAAGCLAAIAVGIASGRTGTLHLIKPMVVAVALAAVLMRSMWVKIDPPEGVELGREQAPRFFAMLDSLRDGLNALPIHRVLVDDGMNACVCQVPRFGILGWYANWLVVGLPLMQATDPDELRAVVAHELGHLSRNHGKFGGWIYRVQATWQRAWELGSRKSGGAILASFMRWYVPRLGAWSFVLRRQNEYEADQCAARLASPQAAGRSLVAVNTGSRFLEEEFWPSVYRGAAAAPTPPRDGRRALGDSLRRHVEHAGAEGWIQASLNAKTDCVDTHPCLRDRLAGIGFPGIATVADLERAGLSRQVPHRTAAEEYLGSLAEGLDAAFAGRWIEQVGPQWREVHEEAARRAQRLDELDKEATAHPLPADKELERADLVEGLRSGREALPLFRQLLERDPDNARAAFAVGRLMLADGDDGGLAWIEHAMSRDPQAVVPGCELAHGYLSERGRHEEARKWTQWHDQFMKEVERAHAERSQVARNDRFSPHGLDVAAIAAVRTALSGIPEVRRAWIVAREVRHLAAIRSLVVGVDVKFRGLRIPDSSMYQTVADSVAEKITVPEKCEFQVICVNDGMGGWVKPLSAVPDSLVFQREG